ncbi:hypothetical protein [Actinoplanes utahensis]|uniref:Uncharacterized protein n=1 Tax=Actinoplanes utahensis TaxID=1869 RepID=A0A0A6UEY8_ACTUT|nr:hypothetical protein [Actinoplanes utahensis]KHD73648.1 hypothetical protein MB27_33265 [Actinoplanes utahensis]
MTAEEARADDLTALLPTLRLPDEPATAETCTMDLHLASGGTIHVEADGCRRVLVEPANGSSVYRQSSTRLTSLLFP